MNMFQGRRRCYTKELPHGSQSSVELIKVTSQQLSGDKKKHIGAWEEKKKKKAAELYHKWEMLLGFFQLKDTKALRDNIPHEIQCKLLKADGSPDWAGTKRLVQSRGGAVLTWPEFVMVWIPVAACYSASRINTTLVWMCGSVGGGWQKQVIKIIKRTTCNFSGSLSKQNKRHLRRFYAESLEFILEE